MVADKSFEKQIQLVMEEHDLQLPEEITLLSDVDLARTPGIGRVAMRKLREFYPFDRQAYEDLVTRDENDKLRPHREKLLSYYPQMREGVKLYIGAFHKVTAIQVVEFGVAIRRCKGTYLMHFKPVFRIPTAQDRYSRGERQSEGERRDFSSEVQEHSSASWRDVAHSGPWNDVKASGEFGHVLDTDTAEVLPGIEIKDVVKVRIGIDFVDKGEDFHTRRMTLELATGICLEWELFCEGRIG